MNALTRILGHRYGIAALVLVALLAIYGVASIPRPDARAARGHGRPVPVDSAVAVCPDPAARGGTAARVSAITPPTSRKGGQAEIKDVAGGALVTTLTAPGTSWYRDAKGAAGPYAIRAAGALAGGLEVEQTTAAAKGRDKGLAGVRCAAPGTDLWFLLSGPAEAESIDVFLANVDAEPTAVDIEALSGEGPLDTGDGHGIPVDPFRTKVIGIGRSPDGLGSIVDGARVLALHVRATTGRVAASVRVRTAKGVDWAPLTASPTTALVVPGIPGGAGGRRLLIAVPGEFDARVKVQAITANGAFAPQGQDTLDAPAETVTPLDLDQSLAGKVAAVRLASDQPITAGFTAQAGADVAYGAAVPPLGSAGGVVADNRAGSSSVLLTAPQGPAAVRIQAITGQGVAGVPQTVRVSGGRTLEVRVGEPAGPAARGFGIMITPQPGAGPVYAARVLRGKGGQLTVLPVVPAVTSVLLPPVDNSLTAVVP
ncbi:MAG TPA: DUF5719 family protein [Streptosporangiaceae bacterium]|nr:DUF5719 family protein [Streptosporangiaceae bacterium]